MLSSLSGRLVFITWKQNSSWTGTSSTGPNSTWFCRETTALQNAYLTKYILIYVMMMKWQTKNSCRVKLKSNLTEILWFLWSWDLRDRELILRFGGCMYMKQSVKIALVIYLGHALVALNIIWMSHLIENIFFPSEKDGSVSEVDVSDVSDVLPDEDSQRTRSGECSGSRSLQPPLQLWPQLRIRWSSSSLCGIFS